MPSKVLGLRGRLPRVFGVLVCAVALTAAGHGCAGGKVGLDPVAIGIHASPDVLDWNRGVLSALPTYNPSSFNPFQVDLRGYDLSSLDLGDRLADVLGASFDSQTKWPSRLPEGFDPDRFMELGKNPGLGVRSLHAKGVTGKGVGIAIIDAPLLTSHIEYADRLRYYEEIDCTTPYAQTYGAATASIAAGEFAGVAPGADLYFIATTNRDVMSRAVCIDRLLELNELLPEGQRIRVISISCAYREGTNKCAVDEAIARATRQGVFVITDSLHWSHGFRFNGLQRAPLSDPEDRHSYRPVTRFGYYAAQTPAPPADILYVPMESRCTASPTGVGEYAFYAQGGPGWCVPYLAGLYALACQADPDVTPVTFWEAALATGQPVDVTGLESTARGVIVDPVRLIEALSAG